ncbi:MAG TPA: NAD(P)/FAD-dependent oxidoreductase [Nocardioidaceae bacterium]|nr:NAD(P)/FAD-dependent oxidoreductase [Nocardioidaceae bacterium]
MGVGSTNRTDGYDAVVIGAGLGGLSTAALLATNGRRTLVVEQNQVVGGCSQVFRRQGNKYEFDVGVHYIGDCAPGGTVDRLMRGLGLEGRVEFAELDPDGFSTITLPTVTFRVPRGWRAYEDRLADTFPDQEPGIRRCVGTLRVVAEEIRADRPVNLRHAAARAGSLRSMLWWGMRPLARLFDACRLSQEVRTVIAAESGDYGLPPSKAPAALHAGFLDHYLKAGAYYPKGGGQVLAARLTEVIRAHGGRVRTKARVRRVLLEGGRAVGVRLADGEEIRSPVVVSNADIKRTYLELVGSEHLPTRLRRKAERFRMALPLFSLYLAVDFDVRDRLPNSTCWIYPHADIEAIYGDAYAGRVPAQVPVFMTSGTLKDPDGDHTAPPGHSTLELMTIAPADHEAWGVGRGPVAGERYSRSPSYLAVKDKLAEAVLDTACAVIPDLREHIVYRDASSPITQERFTLSTAGACYGLEMTLDQLGPFRPDVTTPIPGLFLAGASTKHQHGIVATLNGGAGTAGAILGRDVLAELRAGSVYGDPSRLPVDAPDWDPLVVARPGSPIRRTPRRAGRPSTG